MKKHIKLIAIVVLIGVFFGCLGGCRPSIDGDTDHQDSVTLSADKSSLDFEGKTYYQLPKDAGVYFSQKDSKKADKYLNVYKDGTPAIISNIFYAAAFYNKSQDAFKVEFWNFKKVYQDSKTYNSPTEYYYNEETYNAYQEFKDSGKTLDRIGFEYYHCAADSTIYTYKLGILSEEASREILGYIYDPSSWDESLYTQLQKRYVTSLLYGMFNCDETGFLGTRLENYDVYKANDEAFLIDKTNSVAIKLSEKTSEEIKQSYLKPTIYPSQNNKENIG